MSTGGAATGGAASTGGGSTGGAASGGTETGGAASGGASTGGADSGGTGGGGDSSTGASAGSGGDPGTGGDTQSGGSGGSVDEGDTWDNYAAGFFVTYCVSCHDDDDMGVETRDYLMESAVLAEVDAIACGVAKSEEVATMLGCSAGDPSPGQFPPGNGPKPDDDERDRLVDWVMSLEE